MLDAIASKISVLICRRENPTFKPCNSSPQSPLQLDQSFPMSCSPVSVWEFNDVLSRLWVYIQSNVSFVTLTWQPNTHLSILPSGFWFKFKQWTELEAILRIWGLGFFSGFFLFHYLLCSLGSRGRLSDELSPRHYN